MADTNEIEEEANASTNASPRRRCLPPGRQALADSMMKSVTASVSKLTSGDPPTIYIVPQRIRQVNEAAYEPQIVSIGPYHNGKERLKGMEEHKWRYLHDILSRNTNHQLKDYLEAIEELEDKARSCYSDNLGPQMGNEFVKMMVLDGCFIVELFLKLEPRMLINQIMEELINKQKQEELKMVHDGCFCVELFTKLKQNEEEEVEQKEEQHEQIASGLSNFNDPKDQILNTTGMLSYIGYDMLLLENQIPFFVLQRIFIMACPGNEPHLLAKIAVYFFDLLMPTNKKIQINDSYYHLLHLFHSHLLPTLTHSKEPNLLCNRTIESVVNKLKNLLMFLPCSNKALLPITNNPFPRRMIPCAADLQLAGVKFKKKEKPSSILDVKFNHGVLEIPPLWIDDTTNTIFRNLVTFEQCCSKAFKATSYFTSYFWFMDCIVNTSEDVALLHRNEILDHGLGSDEDVAQLFNRLCIGIFLDIENSYLWDLHHQNVQKHCKNKWNMWRASLKRDYFTNPWSVLSLIAASILLLVTITQTFFTVLPYYRPRS